MGKARTIARRTFIVGATAVAGGVAFGAYSVRKDPHNPLADDLAAGEATFNPWIRITDTAITLVAPHGDGGQGVLSAQAALIAEEMDLDWGDFEVGFGKPSPAYWNRAMANEAAPFAATNESGSAEAVRGAMTAMVKLLGMQLTGGSTSMPDSFDKLREAGAMARETLKLAASQRTGEPVGRLTTQNGAVILPDGSELRYTELAAEAALLDPVEGTPLRDHSQWRLIGKPMARLDIVGKSTGTLAYGLDLSAPGMVHAAVKTNPRKGGAMLSYDASAAAEMPGVLKIVEFSDGVAVLATNTWYAMRAVDKVEFEWGPAPYPAEQEDHWKRVSDSFTEENLDRTWLDDGDIETALAEGQVVEAEYRLPYVAHAPLEPLNVLITVTDDGVELLTGHQMPRIVQQHVAEVTGHDPEDVAFKNQFMGGSFGHRLEFDHLRYAAEIALQVKGTPVKLTYSREQDFAQDYTRHIAIGRGKAVIRNGRVEGIDLSIASPPVIRSQMARAGIPAPGPDTQIAAGSWNNPYTPPHFRMRAYAVDGLAPTSSWRAVGANNGGFSIDCLLDEAIHAAGADPLEERLRLLDHDVSRKVLETVGEMSNWGSERKPNTGRGVAFVESFGVPTAQVIEVTNTDAGIRINTVWIACDVGVVVDPVNFENLVQGGVIFGLGHAMNCEITYRDGMAEQSNYHAHEAMRLYQCPDIHVKGLENGTKIRGIGEPPVPPAAPALANAIFAATGKRIRELPLNKHVDFL